MGYLFLMIALLAGTTKGYCGKKTGGLITATKGALLANLIRMGLCILIGFAVVFFGGNTADLIPSVPLLAIGALSGIFTALFVVTWLICVKRSAYMLLDVFLMLGVLIPLLAGNLFFEKRIKGTQWLGILVLLAAVILMCSYNNSIKAQLSPTSILLLLLCGTTNGIADFSQKLFVKTLPDVPVSVFNLYTYLFAGVVLAVAYLVCKPGAEQNPKRIPGKMMGYIVVMAICLFLNSYFKTLAAEHLDTVLLYPLNQGLALVLSTVMATALFREKLTAKAIFGILTAFAGLIIINLI